jgi:hypothetical protein
MQSDEDCERFTSPAPSVFILGAGVSAALGIPLAKDILRETLIDLGTTKSAEAKTVHDLLRYFYPYFSLTDRNYPNIEDFLNLLEMARLFNNTKFVDSSKWKETGLKEVQQIVLRAIANYIFSRQNTNRADPSRLAPKALEKFIKHTATVHGVFITFNWDLTFEATFSETNPGRRLRSFYDPQKTSDMTTLLKPHGSINWFAKSDLKEFKGLKPRKLFDDVFTLDQIDLLLAQDLISATPLIVPPISNKNFSDKSVFQQAWVSTYWAIRRAQAVTILGYSLPREDQFARVVIRRALRNNIHARSKNGSKTLKVTVVNPDASVEQSFAQVAGREKVDFRFRGAYFQDYVEAIAS